ncbi:MAG: YnbE family lipoprotein [Nitrospirales bacterium]|nr:YnbE family lipoprotein [Nitrospirales bacterium]
MNRWQNTKSWLLLLVPLSLLVFTTGCSPKVEVAVEAPEKPITINLNVKIDHEVRIKVDKELDDVLSDDSELF